MKTAEEHEREMVEKYRKSMQGDAGGSKISSIVCPHFYQKNCPVCDLTYAYYQARLGKEHYLRQKAHDLNRKMRYYSNVIFPANPSEVVLFEYGDVIFKMLFGFFNDPKSEYKGYTDPYQGRNCVIKKTVPGGNKRLTDYFIEMKVQQTQLPDMGVVQRLHNLSNVVELVETGKVKPYYQSQLPEDRTEIRILPSWFGPKFTVFYAEIPYHYITKEEFDAICTGKVNPFADVGIKSPVTREAIIVQKSDAPPTDENPWAGVFTKETPDSVTMSTKGQSAPVQQPEPQQESAKPDPICFGSYDANSPLCTVRCVTLGFINRCKRTTAMATQPTENDQKALRETAARLYK